MGHNFCGTIRSFLLILALSTCYLTAAPPDGQARIEQLEENYVNIKEHFEAKIIDLEKKVGQLEEKIKKQDSLLAVLKKGLHPLKDNIDTNQHLRPNAILRTCHEINVANPSYPSGMYWIDPDGQGIGDPPIHVYCDMEAPEANGDNWWFDAVKGTTSIVHDSESEMDIGSCTEPGCYSRQIKYNASDVQIQALIQFSENCAQNIEYYCRNSPLKYNGTVYAWWYDKDGNRKEFPSSTNCVNLDDTEKTEHDSILSRDTVPYTRILFSNPFKGSGKHKVSRLRCHGKENTEAMPRSCEDLWRMGHTLNGIYSVRGDKQVETVFCQFDKRHNEQDFQKRIGYQDIKTRPIYFYVQKDKSFSQSNVSLPFERSLVNIGGAMDLPSGVFTAPVNGTYFFSFAGLAQFPMPTGPDPVPVLRELGANLYKNVQSPFKVLYLCKPETKYGSKYLLGRMGGIYTATTIR
ncbi:uncharacterized protein LOC130694059 isoform X2 [Daphnia carinata]|uniref:uncharacterized protein LOC130694059 isoform X2 n=1 Tax=Daphnia carinata TaxID=120202 RepID=UPI00257A848A|nr:uncharacterized protein LOC130694059 isoform X2 [Daphnia carinata]